MDELEGADSEERRAGADDMSNVSENPTHMAYRPVAGSVCSFEHPRGIGEQELRRIADLQHGCVHRRQIRAAGFGRGWIQSRTVGRTIELVNSDVFQYSVVAPDSLTRAMAAVLHLKGDALISGPYASWVWEIYDQEPSEVHVLLIHRNARAMPGVVIHRTPAIHREDIRWRKGLPITSPARSWLDFAAVGRPDEVESALAVIRRQKLATDKQLQATWERMPSRAPGRRLAEDLLTAEPGSLSLTRSIYERRLLALIAAAKLATPRTNIRVGPYEVDAAYLDEKVIVEFDGWRFHRGRFREDRSRDAWLAAHGWLVLRFTADRVDHEPLAVAAEIAATLALRGRRSA